MYWRNLFRCFSYASVKFNSPPIFHAIWWSILDVGNIVLVTSKIYWRTCIRYFVKFWHHLTKKGLFCIVYLPKKKKMTVDVLALLTLLLLLQLTSVYSNYSFANTLPLSIAIWVTNGVSLKYPSWLLVTYDPSYRQPLTKLSFLSHCLELP